MTRIGCIGLSHRNAPLAVREALCLEPPVLERLYAKATGLRGLAILTTCNRLEFYIDRAADDVRPVRKIAEQMLPQDHGEYLAAAQRYTYEYEGVETVRHLARVAAGLESMVLGEAQILGQVQDSLRFSDKFGLASHGIKELFSTAVKVGRRVRNESQMGKNPMSVASVAVDLSQRLLRSLEDQAVTIIGAGATGRLVAKILHGTKVEKLTVLNRTEAHAHALAEITGADARPLSELKEVLRDSDIVFGAAGGEDILVNKEVLQGRKKPLLVLDLAIPRSVDPAVEGIPGVRLFDMDSLKAELDVSLMLRRAAVPQAEAIVEEELDAFEVRVHTLKVEPLIRDLRIKAESIRREELERAFANMNGLSENDRRQLRHFSHSLVNKLLHHPTIRLRERATHNGASQETDLIKDLFSL